jgi:hypothetical protein
LRLNFNFKIKIWFQNRRAKDRKISKQKKRVEVQANTDCSKAVSCSADASANHFFGSEGKFNSSQANKFLNPPLAYSNWPADSSSIYSKQMSNGNMSASRHNYETHVINMSHENYNSFDQSTANNRF